MKKKIITSLICAVVFLIGQTALAVETTHVPNNRFFAISDIHFDPFASCEKSSGPCRLAKQLRSEGYRHWKNIFEADKTASLLGYYHDTDYILLKASLKKLQEMDRIEHPRFVIIGGDFLVHSFRDSYITYTGDTSGSGYQQFVKKTLQFLTEELNDTFPEIDIYPVVGNNDSYTDDYSVIPNGKFFHDVNEIWAPFMKEKENQLRFQKTFPIAGYYAVAVPDHEDQRIIVLDTVLFTAYDANKKNKGAAEKELSWLHQQLVAGVQHHRHLLLVFHIPFGIDIYSTLKNLSGHLEQFWQPEYTDLFEADMNHFSSVITGILPSHIHFDKFYKIKDNISVNFIPSISPILGNNPGFKIFTYDPNTFALKQFSAYFCVLKHNPDWRWKKKYTFRLTFH